MSELVRESLRGVTGQWIRDALLALVETRDKAVNQGVRNGVAYGELRYNQGVADGVRLALATILEKKES